jgi:ribosomal protein S18 acetylase RimI-like enzyme
VHIRKATRKDAEAIARFNEAMALETESKQLDAATIRNGVKAVFHRPELGFYMVADVDGDPVACLMVTQEWSDWRNGVFWWIQSVYVRPDFRRQGIYRHLYDALRERARSESGICGFRLYVETENHAAQATYRSLGMEECHYRMFEELI